MKTKIICVLLALLVLANLFLIKDNFSILLPGDQPDDGEPAFSVSSVSDAAKAGIIPMSKLLIPDPVPAYTIAQTDVYDKPDKGSAILTTLAAHSEIQYIDTKDGWSRIMIDGKREYVDETHVMLQKESNGHLIAIDAGHQQRGNMNEEPVGPGSTTMKPKVSHGTSGKASGLKEYELTLMIALKLQKELEFRGYEVLMIRTTHDVNISNSQRAIMANEANADAFIRIHANSSKDETVNGAHTLYQSAKNRHNGELHEQSKALSYCVINDMCKATGLKNNEPYTHDVMSGINWAKVPVTLLEMGYMSNKEDDLFMANEENQFKIVFGIANGIDRFIAGDKE